MAGKKLYKSSKHRMICGVCGGFAEFFKIDPTIVRLIFVAVMLLKGIGLLAYVICALVMPSDLDESDEKTEAETAENTEKTTSDTKKKKTRKAPHTDEEFDSYFTNK